jgi:hypothetical protein
MRFKYESIAIFISACTKGDISSETSIIKSAVFHIFQDCTFQNSLDFLNKLSYLPSNCQAQYFIDQNLTYVSYAFVMALLMFFFQKKPHPTSK